MPLDDITDRLRALGFRSSRETLRALLTKANKDGLTPDQVCEQLVVLEHRERDGRNLARRTRDASLGAIPPLDRFDWNHPRHLDRSQYEHLLTGEYARTGRNVLFRGPSGVGKTTLAQHLGLEALRHGHTVRFSTLAGAMNDLLKQESLPAVERRMRRYSVPDVLILDEIGFLPCDNRAADLFFNIISRRHEKRSTIITTNLPFKLWGTIFPGAACIAALIDRFVQHCHVIDIEGDSWRQKSAPKRSEPSPTA